jgi:hypothetical protein
MVRCSSTCGESRSLKTTVREMRDVSTMFLELNELSRSMRTGSDEREATKRVLRFQLRTLIDLAAELDLELGGGA